MPKRPASVITLEVDRNQRADGVPGKRVFQTAVMQLQMIPDRLSPCPGYLRARPYCVFLPPGGRAAHATPLCSWCPCSMLDKTQALLRQGTSVRICKRRRQVGSEFATFLDFFWREDEPWVVLRLPSGRRTAVPAS